MWDQHPTTVPAVAVVNAFLHRAVASGAADFTPSKAHDLVYLTHGLHLARQGKRLTADGLHADAEGVFSPSTRSAGCRGTRRIDKPLTRMLPDGDSGLLREQTPLISSKSELNELINSVWSRWGLVSSFDLREFTRAPGSPWDLVWNGEERHGTAPRRIPDSTIRCWFMRALAESETSVITPAAELNAPRAEARTPATEKLPSGVGVLRPV